MTSETEEEKQERSAREKARAKATKIDFGKKKIEIVRTLSSEYNSTFEEPLAFFARIREVLNRANPDLVEKWDNNEPDILFNLVINDKEETLAHFVCQELDLELAHHLFCRCYLESAFKKYKELEKKKLKVNKWVYKDFAYRLNKAGETPLYQCLRRLNTVEKDKAHQVINMVKIFIDDHCFKNPNFYVHPMHETSILHLLIESENLELLDRYLIMITPE